MGSIGMGVLQELMYSLQDKADYGIRGEKPIALAALSECSRHNKIGGMTLWDLLDSPLHNSAIKSVFIEPCKKSRSPIVDPTSSWAVVTGINRELQRAISPRANRFFASLTGDEMAELADWSMKKIMFRRTRRVTSSR